MSTKRKPSRKPWRENVAEEMIRQIEAGTAPFQKPWTAGIGAHVPHNPTSDKAYRGINALWLEMQGHEDPRWLTYKQAEGLGAQVRDGEKASQVEYWKWSETKSVMGDDGKPVMAEDGKPQTQSHQLDRPKVFYANVFNAEQIDGLEPYKAPELTFEPVSEAERLLTGSGVPIKHDQGDRAYYGSMKDEVHLPDKAAFGSAYEYYATALHEVGHATGHSSRLARDFGPFGSEVYAKEELRAEMASYQVSRELGLGHYPARHASYVESWLKAIKEDRNVLFQAARDADQIASWIKEPALRPALERDAQLKKKGSVMSHEQEQETATERAQAQGNRVYIAVPFTEKDQVKLAGAKWDRRQKSWFVPKDVDQAAFQKWLPATAQENQPGKQVEGDEKEHDPVAEFSDELKAVGVTLKDAPVMDGKWHRAALDDDKKGEKSASYRAFLDGHPNGQIQNFRSGDLICWVSRGESLSEEQRATLKAVAAQRQAERAAERKAAHDRVAKTSQALWDKADPVLEETPYLKDKQVYNFWLKQDGRDNTLIPMRDVEGKLWSVQTIAPDGTKRFEKDGRKTGLMYVIDPGTIDPGNRAVEPEKLRAGTKTVFIAESYSTAASVLNATQSFMNEMHMPVVVAFDAGNLKPVAEAIHKKYPAANIVIAADNDHKLENTPGGNVGLRKAEQAALAVGGTVIAPVFDQRQKDKGLSDWNDLNVDRGVIVAGEQIQKQLGQQKFLQKPTGAALGM